MLKETIIALTLYGEAGNQDYQGKLMVASTIVQRAKDSHKTLAQICQTPKWYSCWNGSGTKLVHTINSQDGFKTDSWLDCVTIAYGIHKIKPQGYTHYHTQNIVPYWARKAFARRAYVKHGSHLFYKRADLK
jgi:spore germination cell wall hydrolase CwlJ-like protein